MRKETSALRGAVLALISRQRCAEAVVEEAVADELAAGTAVPALRPDNTTPASA